jgi:hypothetical protein
MTLLGSPARNPYPLADNKLIMQPLPNSKMLDPRQPRLGAGVTNLFAFTAVVFGILGEDLISSVLYAYTTFMFIWAVLFRKIKHPYTMVFALIRKFLAEPKYMEDPRAPFFAQKIGLTVSTLAFIFSMLIPTAGIGFGIMLFVASALNAYFNVCIGCILYLRLRKIGFKL